MDGRGFAPDVRSYSAAIELLREMESKGVEPNVVSYTAAIGAYEKSESNEEKMMGIGLLRAMEDKGIVADTISAITRPSQRAPVPESTRRQ